VDNQAIFPVIACKSRAVALVVWVAACVVVWTVAWEAGAGAEAAKSATDAEKSDISLATATKVVLVVMEVVPKADMVEVAAEGQVDRLVTLVEVLDTCREIVPRDKSATTVSTP